MLDRRVPLTAGLPPAELRLLYLAVRQKGDRTVWCLFWSDGYSTLDAVRLRGRWEREGWLDSNDCLTAIGRAAAREVSERQLHELRVCVPGCDFCG